MADGSLLAGESVLVTGGTGGIGGIGGIGKAPAAGLAAPRLDMLVNDAVGFWAHRRVTADGLEHTFALNHLAPFLLTNLLLARLLMTSPARGALTPGYLTSSPEAGGITGRCCANRRPRTSFRQGVLRRHSRGPAMAGQHRPLAGWLAG